MMVNDDSTSFAFLIAICNRFTDSNHSTLPSIWKEQF